MLRHLLITLSLVILAAPAAAEQQPETKTLRLIGAGASFPAPLYLRWFRDYYLEHPQVEVDYQSIGSAGGVKNLADGRLDFAGTDLMLTEEQASEVPGGVLQVPMAAGGIAVIYNLEGVPELNLSRDALIGIFSGAIARWNDPAIAAANAGVTLPDLSITVVARAGASGTSFKFSRYLSALSPEFASEVGPDLSPSWSKALKLRGGLVRGRGNDGVAAIVRAIPGSIGYVQYAFGFLPGIQMAALENRAGNMIAPGKAGFEATLDAMEADHSLVNATDPAGAQSYPILGMSWLIMRKNYEDPAKLATLKDVVRHAMGPGQAVTEQLGYVRFPQAAIEYVEDQLK
jgi:phosphate transport system substrate-binding protein